jgi:hypothetical protein
MSGQHTRPAFIPLPEASAFPPDLVAMPNWVCYDLEERDSGWTKVPINPRTGRYAKTNDVTTWGTFEEARALAARKGIGLGFMLAPPLFGFDLDHCIIGGQLSPLAQSVLGELHTYAETSISAGGVKGIGYGTKPSSRCRRKGLALEIYSERRLFALTGLRLPDAPLAINDCQEGLDFIHGAAFGEEPVAESVAWDPATVTDDDDQAVIDSLHNYRNGAKFARYWRGVDDGDPSGGDQGLANIIAWRVGPDPARIEAIFNASARAGRAKWQRRADYRERTIKHAIERCNGRFYESRSQPRPATPPPPPKDSSTSAESPDPVLSEYLAMPHEELAQRAYRAEQQVARAQKTLTSVIRIRSNPHIKAERDTLTACIFDIKAERANGRADAEGWVRQPAVRIADTAGKGDKTVSKHRHLAEEWGLIELKLVQETDPVTGQRRTVTYARTKQEPDEALDALVTLNPDRGDKEDWGGKREPCPVCQSQRRLKITACADCGHEFSRKIEEPPADTPLPEREELRTDDVGNIAPISVEELAQTGTYPPVFVAQTEEIQPPKGDTLHAREALEADDDPFEESDDWDPYECNHRGCVRPVVVGSRYCGEHRRDYEYAPPVAPPGVTFTIGEKATPAPPAPPEEPWYEPPVEIPPDDPTLPYGTLEETPEGLMEVIIL